MIAHLIDAQIAALALDLRGHDDRLAAPGRIGDALQKTARGGNAADAIALDDDRIAHRKQKPELRGARAGDELHERHAVAKRVIEHGLVRLWLPDVLEQLAVAQRCKLRVVDARERVKALGAHLAGARAEDDLAVKHDLHAGGVR